MSCVDGPAEPASPPAHDFLQLSLTLHPYPSQKAFISECLAQEQDKESTLDEDNAQLTIFYAGRVHVYDNVPSHKAQALMLLVRSQEKGDLVNHAKQGPSLSSIGMQDMNRIVKRRSHRELPLARKASFARFLKTRKARVQEDMILKKSMEQEAMPKASDLS